MDTQPNRWNTTVSIEVYIHGQLRHMKWFHDLQMAHIWVLSQERINNDTLSCNRDFVDFANAFDRRWELRPNEGCSIASSRIYRYRATYEPSVPYGSEDVPFVFHPVTPQPVPIQEQIVLYR